MRTRFRKDDRIQYTRTFLEDTGQFPQLMGGPDPPCHWGPNARGTVTEVQGGPECNNQTVFVTWDDRYMQCVLATHIEHEYASGVRSLPPHATTSGP